MNIDSIKTEVNKRLTDKRRIHTMGVVDTAVKLAKIYGENEDKAKLASLCHDIFRGVPTEELNELVKKYNLGNRYLDNANLAHGKLAAKYIQDEFGIADGDIINAVSFHTTGRANMSLLEKIVFIADAIEPGRNYPQVDEIRDMAFKDIDKACLLSLKGTVDHLISSGYSKDSIDIDTLEAIDYFINKEKCIDDK